MRAFAVALTLILTAVIAPVGTPSTEAASYEDAYNLRYIWTPIIYVEGVPGSQPTVMVFPMTGAVQPWNCIITEVQAPAVDTNVTCTGTPYNGLDARCTGVRVGAISGDGSGMGPTVAALIDPIMEPPVILGSSAGTTSLQVTGTCNTDTASIGFFTPGADAASANGGGTTFSCRVQISDNTAASPWNAFCMGTS